MNVSFVSNLEKNHALSRGLNGLVMDRFVLFFGPKSEGIPLWWYQWLNAKMQYLQCISKGDTAVLHLTIDTRLQSMVCCTPYWIWWKSFHDDVTIRKSFLHYWHFWSGIHQSVIHFHHKWPLMWSFDTSFVVSLNTLLNKQSNGQ